MPAQSQYTEVINISPFGGREGEAEVFGTQEVYSYDNRCNIYAFMNKERAEPGFCTVAVFRSVPATLPLAERMAIRERADISENQKGILNEMSRNLAWAIHYDVVEPDAVVNSVDVGTVADNYDGPGDEYYENLEGGITYRRRHGSV